MILVVLYQGDLSNVARFLRKKNENLYLIYVLIGTPDENRTHNCPLGGDCYIHLTTEAVICKYIILFFAQKCNDFLLGFRKT